MRAAVLNRGMYCTHRHTRLRRTHAKRYACRCSYGIGADATCVLCVRFYAPAAVPHGQERVRGSCLQSFHSVSTIHRQPHVHGQRLACTCMLLYTTCSPTLRLDAHVLTWLCLNLCCHTMLMCARYAVFLLQGTNRAAAGSFVRLRLVW